MPNPLFNKEHLPGDPERDYNKQGEKMKSHPLLRRNVPVHNDPLNLEHQRTKDMTREEAEKKDD